MKKAIIATLALLLVMLLAACGEPPGLEEAIEEGREDPPLGAEYVCQDEVDLARYKLGDTTGALWDLYLVKNPFGHKVSGIVPRGAKVMVWESQEGFHCANIKGDIYYYVVYLGKKETIEGFAKRGGLGVFRE